MYHNYVFITNDNKLGCHHGTIMGTLWSLPPSKKKQLMLGNDPSGGRTAEYRAFSGKQGETKIGALLKYYCEVFTFNPSKFRILD